jgi:glycosyltransferase involved in cell wall biosynthesis
VTLVTPRISVVIPAYNEAKLLPRLLDSVDAARRNYHGGPDAIEVIVADNASTDRTAQIADARGVRVVAVAKRAIAAARNGGARAAAGAILAFIDADSAVHPDTFNEIDRVLTDRIVGGATGLRLDTRTPGRVLSFAMLLAVGFVLRPVLLTEWPRLNIDAGVVFLRRADFERIGGYREDHLFAEDVRLLIDLRRLGRSRGQHLARSNRAPAMFSTRKFDEHGEWHYFLVPFRLLSPKFVRKYWYERKNDDPEPEDLA